MYYLEYEFEIDRLEKLKKIYNENMTHYTRLSKTSRDLTEREDSSLTILKISQALIDIDKALLNLEMVYANYQRGQQFISAPILPTL